MMYAVLTARLALAGVLLLSAVAKTRAFSDTQAMVDGLLRRSGHGVRRLARPLAVALIAVEATTGFALLGPKEVARFGLIAAVALAAGFTAIAIVATVTHTEVSCACFGRPTARLGRRHIARNAPLLGLAVVGLWGSGAVSGTTPAPPAIVLCVLTAVVITAVTAFFDDIVDLLLSP
ncbi:MauE/DoxX family redox-associated membrane protein [Streptomyces sp. NPDC005953]|uniref:MauE/DoxX family redox-associated membrane protein n=1 Tax=unclassified Streptomyces TaxID=2593676 RepID=UPI0033C977D2